MKENLENCDEGATHGQAQNAPDICHEPNEGNLLFTLDLRDGWILDVYVDQC